MPEKGTLRVYRADTPGVGSPEQDVLLYSSREHNAPCYRPRLLSKDA